MDEQSDESEEEEVMGERMGESEIKELVPEWGWNRPWLQENEIMLKSIDFGRQYPLRSIFQKYLFTFIKTVSKRILKIYKVEYLQDKILC